MFSVAYSSAAAKAEFLWAIPVGTAEAVPCYKTGAAQVDAIALWRKRYPMDIGTLENVP